MSVDRSAKGVLMAVALCVVIVLSLYPSSPGMTQHRQHRDVEVRLRAALDAFIAAAESESARQQELAELELKRAMRAYMRTHYTAPRDSKDHKLEPYPKQEPEDNEGIQDTNPTPMPKLTPKPPEYWIRHYKKTSIPAPSSLGAVLYILRDSTLF